MDLGAAVLSGLVAAYSNTRTYDPVVEHLVVVV